MKILLLGAAGFVGTNLAIRLSTNSEYQLTLADASLTYFTAIRAMSLPNVSFREFVFSDKADFDALLAGQDVVYHLASTNIPTTSNQSIPDELQANIIVTAHMLEACVRCGVKKVVFISSGGTVYGKEVGCPLKETTATYPISSYGIQKVTIEKILYLYHYMYGIDYRIIRLANPYGPYQRPNGTLGAVTTFTYKAIKKENIVLYGDGSVIRDFIYIDDAVRAIVQIADGENQHRTFNVGCGYGTSIREVLDTIENVLGTELVIERLPGRKVDVPVNFLDISRYEKAYGALHPLNLSEGIRKTADFLKKQYHI
jgi:UDP-glucose 4-epimerase